MRPETRYAKAGDLSIAYQVVGEGPFDLVWAPAWVSHVEEAWEDPLHARFLERLAAFSRPVRLEWPRRGRPDPDARPEPAALIVRVESAFALELQHLAPLLIERINAHYGWRCVGRLVLKQGPVPRPKPARTPAPKLSDEDREKLAETTAGIAEEPLREALTRLGSAVVAGARTKA